MTGHLAQRGKGKWALVLSLGRGEDGRHKQKWISFHGNKREAQQELARLIAQGSYQEPSRMTLSDLLDRWFAEIVKPNTRRKTYEMWKGLIRVHIGPDLGYRPLVDVSPLEIQAYYRLKMEKGRRDGKRGGLSAQTVRHMHTLLHVAFGQAVRWQILTENVLDRVTPPRIPKQRPKTWTTDEAARFLAAATDDEAYPIVLMAALTGLRRGEIFGMRWRAVDLHRSIVSVLTTLLVSDSGIFLQDEQKTDGSVRRVDLPPVVVSALYEHKRRQDEHKAKLGPLYRDQDLVFSNPMGLPIHPSNFRNRVWKKLIERAGVPYIPFHGLRHTHATVLLEQGVHPRVVSERLGHSSVEITLDTYSHVLPTMQRAAALAAEEAIFSKRSIGDRGGERTE